MKLSHFRPAVQYYFGASHATLNGAVHNGDAAMASYLLEHHPGTEDGAGLGLALIYVTDKAGADGKAWAEIVRQIRQQPHADTIRPSVVGNCLTCAASNRNEGMVQALLQAFAPQVSALTAADWDHVLFECLPKGDPEKRRIEKRNFEDREGHAGILTMVRAAMGGGVAPGVRCGLQPRP